MKMFAMRMVADDYNENCYYVNGMDIDSWE